MNKRNTDIFSFRVTGERDTKTYKIQVIHIHVQGWKYYTGKIKEGNVASFATLS